MAGGLPPGNLPQEIYKPIKVVYHLCHKQTILMFDCELFDVSLGILGEQFLLFCNENVFGCHLCLSFGFNGVTPRAVHLVMRFLRRVHFLRSVIKPNMTSVLKVLCSHFDQFDVTVSLAVFCSTVSDPG